MVCIVNQIHAWLDQATPQPEITGNLYPDGKGDFFRINVEFFEWHGLLTKKTAKEANFTNLKNLTNP